MGQESRHITRLELAANGIGADGAAALAAALAANPWSFTGHVELSGNELGDAGAVRHFPAHFLPF